MSRKHFLSIGICLTENFSKTGRVCLTHWHTRLLMWEAINTSKVSGALDGQVSGTLVGKVKKENSEASFKGGKKLKAIFWEFGIVGTSVSAFCITIIEN